ncbi:PAS domain S-box protein [Spirosoma sp. KUDC1026]|uniref:PAS domain-containing sensor histidine kinase n=1 Tax=Spirosoma sp. KUDC1026 TaxID=2745947 RepID=UPI00159BAC34|nr:PAS domain S-box protein [Spirosoma sp. KUDC1026]QKZ13821.1 PAS domain S-box protein [Spirosoma sp. KUDC1026]
MTGDPTPFTPDDTTAENKRLAFALQAAGVGTWDLDITNQQVWWDDCCKRLYGFDQADVVPYQQVLHYMHPDDQVRVNTAIQWALNSESDGQYDIHFRIHRVDNGLLRWLHCQGKAYFNADRMAYRFSGIAQDATQQKLAESARQLVGQRFQAAFEKAALGIVIATPDGQILLVNEAYSQLTGYSVEELYRQNYKQFTHPDDLPANERLIDQLGRGEIPFVDFEKRYIRKDGSICWVRVNISQLVNQEHQIDGLIAIFQDINAEVATRQQAVRSEQQLRAMINEQEVVQQQLTESETRFRSLVEESPVAMLVCIGPDMLLTQANEKMLALFGRDQTIIGRPIMEAIPELLATPLLGQYRHVVATGETHTELGAQILLMKEGQPYIGYYDYIYKALRDRSGAIEGVICTAVEVTEQVMAHQRIEESEATLLNAIELAELGTWKINVATGEIIYSEQLQTWLGVTGAVLGGQASPRVHPKDRQRISLAIEKALEKGGTGRYDETYIITNAVTGQERVIHANGQTLFDAGGNPLFLAGTAQDVTLQLELQLALEQQVQQRTEELTASNNELEAANQEYAELTTKLQESNGLLRRSNENLQQFAYVASHDLQEPLRKIQQFGDLLKTRYADSTGDEGVYLDRMQSAASRMSTLIKDLLNFSRISTQRDTSAPVSLQTIVENVLTTLEFTIRETGARIQVGALPTLSGDASQLGQLFQNLLSNALKFRRADTVPIILIQAHRVDAGDLPASVQLSRVVPQYYHIQVADNGVGFDEKYLDRIFQVFQRLHGKSEFIGTGIGLAICEKVVTNHGGAITASSQPGQGATFDVYLPTD